MEDLSSSAFPAWYKPLDLNTNTFDTTVTNNTLNSNSFNLDETLGQIDLGGVASVAGVIGGFLANRDDKKYKREMLNMEKERVARGREKQDAFDSEMKNVWG